MSVIETEGELEMGRTCTVMRGSRCMPLEFGRWKQTAVAVAQSHEISELLQVSEGSSYLCIHTFIVDIDNRSSSV